MKFDRYLRESAKEHFLNVFIWVAFITVIVLVCWLFWGFLIIVSEVSNFVMNSPYFTLKNVGLVVGAVAFFCWVIGFIMSIFSTANKKRLSENKENGGKF